jgi:TonB family protein
MTVRFGRDFVKCAVLVAVLATIAVPSLLSAETLSIPTASAMARVAKKVAPEYPAAARQLNVSGSLEVEITVGEDGSVTEAKVLKGNAMFSSASLSAVKLWKFNPMVQDGVAKSFTSVIVFNFTK